jgi:hypothetical protein
MIENRAHQETAEHADGACPRKDCSCFVKGKIGVLDEERPIDTRPSVDESADEGVLEHG